MSHYWLQQTALGRACHQWLSQVSSNRSTVLISLSVVLLLSRVIHLYRGLRAINNTPGLRVPLGTLSLPGLILPSTWWNPGTFFTWANRFKLYKQYGTDTISVVPFVVGAPSFYSSNLEVIRQIASNGPNASFIKPEFGSGALLRWGMNLFSANGETWRRHRRITGPAFNYKLYEHVFDESIAMYNDMTASEQWASRKTIEIPIFQDLTYKFSMLIMAKCGLGIPFSWSSPPETDDGSMSIQKAMAIVSETSLLAAFAPFLMMVPISRFRKIRVAYREVRSFMETQIAQRKAMIQESKSGELELGNDAFTMLVRANEDEEAKYRLSRQELVGNLYTMLFAGHETTAISLAATIGFMAVYQEVQTEIFEQIESIVGCDRDPVFEDYAKLNKVLAAFLEAIRMFPPGFVLIRQAAKDTVLKVQNPFDQEGFSMVPISKGTLVTGDMIGLQYNPRYYHQPEKYKPSRWYGTENESEAFTGFSIGSRACIGRKFATVEAVAFLTMLLRDWHVEPLLRPGETKQEWTQRVLDGKIVLTLGVNDVCVKFTKRRSPSL
ncbi:hypothetical protein AX15_005083 [Amanita polypyramis BW_CC]|nr:hypothetical protein AX15_005083 [Amanita polypyramis BW_CC]